MKQRFTIGIVGRGGPNPHVACFEDFASALAASLRDLGHETVSFDNPGRLIIFGGGNLIDPDKKMPADAIIFNAEQVAATDDPAEQMSNYENYRTRTVWDYSESNIAALKRLGINAVHCPVSYHPSMAKAWAPVEQDIDVLWYGSVNARRREILDALDATGLRVERLFGVYGAERDAWINRSKVVLNLHFFDRPIFEIFRCSHLFANKKCVVSEAGSQDKSLEAFAERAAWSVFRENIVKSCVDLVADADLRRKVAEKGFVEFGKTSLVENVRKALEQS